MSETKHAPTTWRVNYNPEDGYGPWIMINHLYCQIVGVRDADRLAILNQIVLAVNSHDDLLAALRKALEFIENEIDIHHRLGHGDDPYQTEHREVVLVAIAKAMS